MFTIDLPTTCNKDLDQYGEHAFNYVTGKPLTIDESEQFLSQFLEPDVGKPKLFSHVNTLISNGLEMSESFKGMFEESNYKLTATSKIVTKEGLLLAAVRRIAMARGVQLPIIVNSEHAFILDGTRQPVFRLDV